MAKLKALPVKQYITRSFTLTNAGFGTRILGNNGKRESFIVSGSTLTTLYLRDSPFAATADPMITFATIQPYIVHCRVHGPMVRSEIYARATGAAVQVQVTEVYRP